MCDNESSFRSYSQMPSSTDASCPIAPPPPAVASDAALRAFYYVDPAVRSLLRGRNWSERVGRGVLPHVCMAQGKFCRWDRFFYSNCSLKWLISRMEWGGGGKKQVQ